ncbi:MAG: hypothetical protein EHM35_08400 [Planctomycetaceae bacterium]|nr:MAG: hypothetical protein EHM35_08400 [Planctomycetaceae bacterium]
MSKGDTMTAEFTFDHRVIQQVQQAAAVLATDCPSCAGCMANGRLSGSFEGIALCERMCNTGTCQKQLWDRNQDRRFQAMLAMLAATPPVLEAEIAEP